MQFLQSTESELYRTAWSFRALNLTTKFGFWLKLCRDFYRCLKVKCLFGLMLTVPRDVLLSTYKAFVMGFKYGFWLSPILCVCIEVWQRNWSRIKIQHRLNATQRSAFGSFVNRLVCCQVLVVRLATHRMTATSTWVVSHCPIGVECRHWPRRQPCSCLGLTATSATCCTATVRACGRVPVCRLTATATQRFLTPTIRATRPVLDTIARDTASALEQTTGRRVTARRPAAVEVCCNFTCQHLLTTTLPRVAKY